MDIEAGSFYILVLHHKVFGGKQFSKMRLDFVVDSHRSFAYEPIIQKKRVVKPSCVPVWKVVINNRIYYMDFGLSSF
jgi:hypothetical protein